MNTDTLVLSLIFSNISYYLWMITWLKNVNNFQTAKVQPQGVAYKSVAYKKCVLARSLFTHITTNVTLKCLIFNKIKLSPCRHLLVV